MPFEGQLKCWSHKCEDFRVYFARYQSENYFSPRGILWHFVIKFVEEIYNEILIKMFKSAGGLLVTDKIKFKIITSRHQAYHFLKIIYAESYKGRKKRRKIRHVDQLEEQEKQQSKYMKRNVIRTLTVEMYIRCRIKLLIHNSSYYNIKSVA